jgi:hypothetical protein
MDTGADPECLHGYVEAVDFKFGTATGWVVALGEYGVIDDDDGDEWGGYDDDDDDWEKGKQW